MQLDTIKQLSVTARIQISDEEAEGLLKDLAVTLEYVDQVNKVSLPESGMYVPEHHNAYREDIVTNIPGSYTEILMAEVPEKQDGYVKVKKIFS